MAKAKIVGVGRYAPGEPIDNAELARLAHIEFDAEKTENKLGIKQRHIAKLRGIQETTADFATRAALAAIEDAQIDPMDVNLFIVGTDTPEYISPATGVLVQGRIQKQQMPTAAFDLSASCASFTSSLDAAARMVATDPTLRYAVVVGVYNMPAFVKDGDAFGYSIFADGAGAVVLQRTEDKDPSGYITGQLMADGTQWDYVGIYSGGAKKPITHELLDKEEYGLQLLQSLPGDRNVKLWPPLVHRLLDKSGLTLADLDHIIFTQINRSVIIEVMGILGLPMDKTTTVMDRYGYTGSGCVPMAFYHAVTEGRVKRGDTVMFVASGAGLSVGSNVFVF